MKKIIALSLSVLMSMSLLVSCGGSTPAPSEEPVVEKTPEELTEIFTNAIIDALKNAVVEARAQGIKAGLIRPITLWPFPTEVLAKAADQVKGFISVELSMGQMIEDVRLATQCKKPVGFCGRCGGMIPSPDEVLESIRKAEKGEF